MKREELKRTLRDLRRLVLELHPDLGGDEDLAKEPIGKYRASAYGGAHG